MLLKHFSNDKLKTINPANFGKNYFTKNDAKISKLPRSFFYVDNSEFEQILSSNKYLHITKIANNKVYNLTENKDNLQLSNIDKILRKLKSKGYRGVVYTINNLQIANIFYPIKVNKVLTNN